MLLSQNIFAPSLLLALDDFVLPTTFLQLFVKCYDKAGVGERNHYISPALTPEAVLKEFPMTRIQMAGSDPLRDESYKFTLKLK